MTNHVRINLILYNGVDFCKQLMMFNPTYDNNQLLIKHILAHSTIAKFPFELILGLKNVVEVTHRLAPY